MRRPFLPLVTLLLAACGPGDGSDAAPADDAASMSQAMPEGVEAISLLGEDLRPPNFPAEVRATYEENLVAARADYEAAPEDVDAIIWLGRRTAYLGRYREAIDIYTRGLGLHPDDARLYRHRGHRWISVREFDRAIADFERAVELTRGTPDEVEPDGLPNARGIPTSTLQFNIWYHLGLAHYLKGDLDAALEAWRACLEVSEHVDSQVATTYWLNNTLRRLDREAEAAELLERITPDLDIIEVGAYLDVLLLHRGERSAEDLLGPTGEDATLSSTTAGYGVAVWHLVNGREEEAWALMERVRTNRDQWSAFGYVASEADLARRDG